MTSSLPDNVRESPKFSPLIDVGLGTKFCSLYGIGQGQHRS